MHINVRDVTGREIAPRVIEKVLRERDEGVLEGKCCACARIQRVYDYCVMNNSLY
jgi:hypothetical protein